MNLENRGRPQMAMEEVKSRQSLRISDILRLPEVIEGNTDLIVGHAWLDRPVRWVHVADSRRVGHLLRGGELLLSTGSGWGEDEEQRRTHVQSFASAGASALLIELGTTWAKVPQEIIEECRRVELPLLVARRELRFVSVTEAVHQKILDRQIEEITMMNAVVETMSNLLYNEAPTEQIIIQCARLLQAPVVLEDPSHAVVCYAEGHHLTSKLLANWRDKSRGWHAAVGNTLVPTEVADPHQPVVTWTFVEVRGRGVNLGRLFYRAEPQDSAVNSPPVAHHILRHTAMTLAVHRLGSPNPHAWTELIERNAVERLIGTRFNSVAGAEDVLEASGFVVRDRDLFACEIFHETAALEANDIRQLLGRGPKGMHTLISPSGGNSRRLTCAVSLPHGHSSRLAVDFIAGVIEKLYGARAAVVKSENSVGALELAMAMRSLRRLPEVGYLKSGMRIVALAETPLDALVNELREDVRVQGFSQTMLDPLLSYDKTNDSDLLATLNAVLDHPTSRSEAAKALHLSRTALYARIERIEALLGVNLNEGKTLFSLGLAIRTLELPM